MSRHGLSCIQVYLSWVNSVLRESSRPVDNVAALQDGRIMCELIDALAPNADLVAKAQVTVEWLHICCGSRHDWFIFHDICLDQTSRRYCLRNLYIIILFRCLQGLRAYVIILWL